MDTGNLVHHREHHHRHKADSYLTRVVLRSWPHTLLVLADCYNALPVAEELGIVDRCLEALASIVSTSIRSNVDGGGNWWFEDVVRLPGAFFARLVKCLRSKHVCERLIGEVIVKWTEVWLFSNNDSDMQHHYEHKVNDRRLMMMITKSCSSSSLLTSTLEDPAGDSKMRTTGTKDGSAVELHPCSPGLGSQNSSLVASDDEEEDEDEEEEEEEEGEERLNVSPERQLCCEPNKCFQVGCSTAVEKLTLLEDLSELLPYERTALPISFLFLLLRYAFAMDASSDCKSQIETRISLQLENATLDDFLMPFKSPTKENCKWNSELDSMKKIIARFLTQQQRNILSASSDYQILHRTAANSNSPSTTCISLQQQKICAVARVWDEYLGEVACDGNISPDKFTELVEIVPAYARTSHDQLYKSIHTFLKAHAEVSPQERASICRALNCLKLSQETCIQAVQNELMPLRTIVQAMFMQQLQTRNAINTHFIRGSMNIRNSPALLQHKNDNNHLFDDKAAGRDSNLIMESLKETNTRLQSLEAAMVQMRKSLRESSPTRLSDLFICNDLKELKENLSGSPSCSSSGSSSQSQNPRKLSNNSKWRLRFFLRKSYSGRSNKSTGNGVAKVAKIFQKMGFLAFCKTSHRNLPDSSFKQLPERPAGCLPIDREAMNARHHKKSWDESEFNTKHHHQHLRHHSVA